LENLIGQGDGQNPLNNRKYILKRSWKNGK
jgi:hypothetical protein